MALDSTFWVAVSFFIFFGGYLWGDPSGSSPAPSADLPGGGLASQKSRPATWVRLRSPSQSHCFQRVPVHHRAYVPHLFLNP